MAHKSFWLWVMCLTGVDYFSTLGYQPSIAFEATGMLTPLATVFLVGMTLFGALPVYAYVARQSPYGLGSIGMLEKLMRGWHAKAVVLVLLGFAATDFVITKTLSAADAAEHLIANPFWHQAPGFVHALTKDNQRLAATMFLLVLLGASFLRGFKEVIWLAVIIVGVYLVVNAVVVGSGLVYLVNHPERLTAWWGNLEAGPEHWYLQHHPPVSGGGWLVIGVLVFLWFPKLALGLSGFETGVAVMPLVKGDPGDEHGFPAGRFRNTRKLLLTAALIMSAALLGSSLVVTTLIEPGALLGTDFGEGSAKDRALAYIAHGEGRAKEINPYLFGDTFGTLYDVSTIVILWFAGASAMAGLINLVPQYLPRYGMAPEWARAVRPLVMLLTGVNLLVTWVFNASVTAQGAAYATGVLVLMTSACVATVIEKWRSRSGPWWVRTPWGYALIMLMFVYTTAAIMIEKPSGLQIALFFIGTIVIMSLVSRYFRSTELRFGGFQFKDDQSRFLWDSMKASDFPVIVPHRPGRRPLQSKEESIRADHRLAKEVPIVFLEAEVGDPSEFLQEPVLEVIDEGERWILRVTRCVSVAHVIAAVGLELSKVGKPPEIHFGWSDESPVEGMLRFLFLGEGNVPGMVHELIRKDKAKPEQKPRIVVG